MNTGKLIAAVFIFALSGLLMILGIRHYMEKGFLLNNAWLYATGEQREKMDRKPYYRQSAVVFWILSAVFFVVGLSLILQNDRIALLEIPLIAGAVIYAVVSSVRISRREKK